MRRLLGMLMLTMAAGTMIPAASAFAREPPASRPGMQRFGVRLVDVPVSAAHNPRALRYIIDYLAPGQAIHRRILILNEESRTAHFTVYPDAARIGHGLFTGDAGETRSELTRWITLKHGSLTLRPHTSALDMVTIRVPRAATRGEHYGVLWAQQVARGRSAHGLRITEVARVGIRIYLAIGRGGAPPTRFVITSLTGHWSTGGQPLLVARVRNTGGRAIDLSGQARLTHGPGGTTAGPFRGQQIITLAPGQSADMTFAPGKALPPGPWLVRITLASGFTTRATQATIQLTTSTADSTWTHLPMIIWGTGLMLALLILAQTLIRHARHARHARQTSRVRA